MYIIPSLKHTNQRAEVCDQKATERENQKFKVFGDFRYSIVLTGCPVKLFTPVL